MNDNRELTVFDVADWFWSYRILAVALLVAAGLWTVISSTSAGGSSLSNDYQVQIRIFASGTPVREKSDIADIVVAHFERLGSVRLMSNPKEMPLMFRADGADKAAAAVRTANEISAALNQEVADQAAFLQTILATNDAATRPYLDARNFAAASRSGLLELIQVTSGPDSNHESPLSIARSALFPFVYCGILFFIVAGTTSFIRAWKGRRASSQ